MPPERQDIGTRYIARHQIRRELYAGKRQLQRFRHRADEHRFTETRNPPGGRALLQRYTRAFAPQHPVSLTITLPICSRRPDIFSIHSCGLTAISDMDETSIFLVKFKYSFYIS